MVIAAFYVMTADVSAEEGQPSNEMVDEAVTSIEHIDRRITISNVMASSPAVAVGLDGETHIAWVDGAPGSQSVAWKRSNDSLKTFTPDKTVTTPFHSISNLSIVLHSAFGVAVVFEGRIAVEASPTVHFLYSAGNDDWSPVHAVSAGNAPSLTTDGDALYIALNVISEGTERYSVAAMRLIDGTINTTLLTVLPVPASDGDIAFFDGMLNVAMVERSSNAIYFMQFTDNGTLVTEPALVSRTLCGRSVDLLSMNGNGRIMFVDNNSLMLARCLGQPNNWVSHTVLELNETILETSLAASDNSIRISYTTGSSNVSNVHVVECSPLGDFGEDVLISTPGLNAASPIMFSIEDGTFSCLYVEEHDDTNELFLRHDIDYKIANIARLPGYISSLDLWMFYHGNDSVSELRGRLNIVMDHHDRSHEALAIENATQLGNDLDAYFVSAPYADLDKVDEAQDIIASNLASISFSEIGGAIVMSLPPSGPGGTIMYEDSFVLSLESLTNTTINAQWYFLAGGRAQTLELGISGHLMWGTTSANTSNRVNGSIISSYPLNDPYFRPGIGNFTENGSRYSANITVPSSNITYFVRAYVVANSTTHSSDVKFICPCPDSLYIMSMNVTTSPGAAIITWTTNCPSTTYLDYGLTSSYGGDDYDSWYSWRCLSLVVEHSVTVTNLDHNTVYHYRLTSNYTYGDFSLSTVSDDLNFTSARIPVVISSITSELTGLNSVNVRWHTNVMSNSTVHYGTTASYGQTTSGSSGTEHTVSISGLSATTTYHYMVSSFASADPSEHNASGDLSFTTQELTISSLSASLIHPNVVRISWTTNFPASSVVHYGPTASYGNTESLGSASTASHVVTLGDLFLSTTYHFKVESGVPGSTKFSSDSTFTTGDLIMSDLSCVLIDFTSARISWTTNFAATTNVQYGITSSYGTTVTGTNGTAHSIDVTGLGEGMVYHYKVTTSSIADPGISRQSSDLTFTTRFIGDAGLGTDAANDISSATLIAPGPYMGYLDSSLDLDDCFALPLLSGQTIKLTVDVPASFNYDVRLHCPTGYLASSSTNPAGVDEGLQYVINSSGTWKIRLSHVSGSGQGPYSLSIVILGGCDRFLLDVGISGDNYLLAHMPGLTLMNGTGWSAISGGSRQAAVNSSFLLNIYDGTYQSSSYYQMSIAYTSSDDVGVQVLIGDSWVTLATMPGSTAPSTYSFVLRDDLLSDSSTGFLGLNVRMRFSHAVVVDSIDAVAVAYAADIFGGTQNYPGVMLENNWVIGDATVNSSASATLVITLPRADQAYMLEFVNIDSCTGIGVQQYIGTAFTTVGTLESWGTSAVIQLNPSYTDILASTPGTSIRVKLTSAMVNVTDIVLWASQFFTDVGVSGDASGSTHTPGISILDNGEWGTMTTLSGVTFRSTVGGSRANFYLNGAESDARYIVSIAYKVTSGTTRLEQYCGASSTVELGLLTTGTGWRTATFMASAINYDHIAGGQLNTLFEINSTTTVAVDSITVHKDRDGDGISDAVEALRITMSSIGTHVHDLNPFSEDTDSDGLNDNVEISSYNTDPCDSDTDSDGLLDGSERYSYTWSTDDSYLIPDNNTVLDIAISVPAIAGGTASITSFCLVLGIMHASQYQLEVKVAKGTGTQKVIKTANTGSGANYFILRNLFTISSPYTASDLASANVWHIYVKDVSTAGEKGRVEYARLQVNGTTNPLDSDSDDDLLLDGEEVEFGTDGWMTNPRSSDSDSDGVSDRNEIIGSTLCGSATDPTRADTDDDGYADNIDRYMGDAVLRITLMEYKTLDTINGQNNVPVFFVINYQDQGQEFATKRVSATKNVLYTLNWIYDVDIPETATYVNVEFEAVAENAGWLGDDAQLDIDQDNTNKYNAYWTISTSPFIGTGTDSGGSYDAYLKMKLERAVAEKARVIVINGTGEDGGYGLDAVSTGVYRYSADDQVYLVVLNVTGTSAHFQSGMNAIILPRAIALQCQLNDTLYDLQNIGSSPLNGASFYSTDPLKATASGHIIAVISKNVTASQAETILTMLTHNATGGRIGNNVTISPTSLYLLHLPNDILSAIPTSVMNAGMGEGPDYYSLGSVIGDIAGMVFDFLVWVATGGVLLLLAHLVKEGLKAISNLVSAAISVVEAAVDRIVDAFSTFVNWIIDLAKNILTSAIPSSLDISGHYCEIGHITSEINSNDTIVTYGSPEAAGKVIANDIANSNLFQIILALCICVFGAITIISTLTMPYGALITKILIPFAISMILPCVLDAIDFNLFSLEESAVEPLIEQILGASLATALTFTVSVAIATVNALKGAVDSILSLGLKSVKGLIFSIIGLALNVYSLTTDNLDYAISASLTGFILSVIGFIDIFTDKGVSGVTSEVIGSKNMLIAFAIFDCGISLLNFERMVDKYVIE
jgi:hypothetical protein